MNSISSTGSPNAKQSGIILFLIVSFALLLRLWKIDYQSLWLDELHTMNEADPALTWKEMFYYLRCCDQHPPLHFFLSKIMFSVFGHTSLVARIPSVIAGTLSVWAVYQLGKEVWRRELGLIAAAITATNYFHLVYSQEARNYIFAFLFSVLSFLYLVRLLKQPTIRNSILYVLCSLLLLYSHYFGLFAMMSQFVIIGLFFLLEPAAGKWRFAKWFIGCGVAIGLGYLPWLPFMMEMSGIKSFWISPVSPRFLPDFYSEYFGYMSNLLWLSVIILLVFVLHVLYPNKVSITMVKERPWPFVFLVLGAGALLGAFKLDLSLPYSLLTFAFLLLLLIWALLRTRNLRSLAGAKDETSLTFLFTVLTIWVVVTYLVPYIRSVMVVPMLFPRYTIVLLPAILIALAMGIALIRNRITQLVVLALFIVLSMKGILSGSKYFRELRKTQYREMTKFVVDNNPRNYPVINEVTHWHQQYYFKLYHAKPVMLPGKKQAAVDSILRKATPQHDVQGFWIVGAHGDKPLTPEEKKGLDTAFILVKEGHWRDSWAELYLKK